MKPNRIKTMLAEGKVVLGGWVTMGSPVVAEIMSLSGFDWLLIDCEHGPLGFETAQTLLQAIQASGVVPFVRVAESNAAVIKRALDIGSMGVVVPLVNDRASAECAVRAAKYPPEGIRGIGLARAHLYGLDFMGYVTQANEEIMVIAQIEHADAIANLDDIVSVPGIDVLFVGPVDLAGSYGHLGVTGELPAEVNQAIEKVIKTAGETGIALGCWAPNADIASQRIAQGFQFVGLGTDGLQLLAGCQAVLKSVKRA